MVADDTTAVRASAFLNKGGVGKSTSVAHLGVALAEQGREVLCIDLAGKQFDLAKQFGLYDDLMETPRDDRWPNIATVFDGDNWENIVEMKPDAVDEMLLDTGEGPDLIPAHEGLDQVDNDLASVPVEQRYGFLDAFLSDHIEPRGYDVVLLDLPGLTNNITLNGLLATRAVYTPVELGDFEERQVDNLLDDLAEIRDHLGTTVALAQVIPNRVDERTTLAGELLADLDERYPDRLAGSPVPQSQDVRNAQREGTTVFDLDDPSATAERVQQAYRANATQLLDDLAALAGGQR